MSIIVKRIEFMLQKFMKSSDKKNWHDFINEHDVDILLNIIYEKNKEVVRLKDMVDELMEELPSLQQCEYCDGYGNDVHFRNGVHFYLRCQECDGNGLLEE